MVNMSIRGSVITIQPRRKTADPMELVDMDDQQNTSDIPHTGRHVIGLENFRKIDFLHVQQQMAHDIRGMFCFFLLFKPAKLCTSKDSIQ